VRTKKARQAQEKVFTKKIDHLRWARRPNQKRRFSFPHLRYGEVKRVLLDRYDGFDADRPDLHILLHARAPCFKNYDDRVEALLDDIEEWAPQIPKQEADRLAAEIAASPLNWKADTIARALQVDYKTRERLCLRTIGSVDVSKREWAALRKIRHRQGVALARRKRGMRTREQWRRDVRQGSVKQILAQQGIPPSTYYYRFKK
jgi:hypothetical protein